MLLSKTQTEIMKMFVSKITQKYSIRHISTELKKQYPLVHRSMKVLLDTGIIKKDEHDLLSLNYKDNHETIAYAESLRKDEFLKKNKTIGLFAKDVSDNINQDFFILLIFGSYAAGKQKPQDVDVLLIIPDIKDTETSEKILSRVSSSFTLDFHCNVISRESTREMLSKRDEINVANETLDNHIIIFGAENYYRLLKYAR